MSNPSEELFEQSICDWLQTHGGYVAIKNDLAQGDQPDFDRTRALDTGELFSFIGATQIEAWDVLIKRYGGDMPTAQAKFADRLSAELDKRGAVDVLRHGVVDLGVTIRLAYFKPAHGLTPELIQRYHANRLTATRQLRYESASTKALDLALFVNGIPVATAELKNPLTGQGVEQAVAQYRTDRDPKNRTLTRAVVHFAVDPQRVAMTTRLAGVGTVFLPFNKGQHGGAGNPPNPQGHATAYLWERVWQRDAWLDLLGRFVHVEKPARASKRPGIVIFPRYHQWDAVLALEAAAREEGAGHSYLVQHSAGSGKSNTIASLAHRLSTLHKQDTKIFDKVVVITDRVVLDRQLQDTIYQFEHAHGLVARIDNDSVQLAAALSGEQARVIITTLWKFPFAMKHMATLPNRRYAIIADEAHSSQTGDAAKDLRKALGAATADSDDDLPVDAAEEALLREIQARGHQPNLSFFAFTATPKGKTLEQFGRLDPATRKHQPFHLYSMRQAIEEGFIHDVLASYTTYETFFHLEKSITDDPTYETVKARRAIARFLTLHEYNLAQKAEIVVEHFRAHVATKIVGKAKAMVVCSSRPHALRFADALRSYIREHGFDTGVLVAYSGLLMNEAEEQMSEAKWNGFSDTQTAEMFDTDAYSIMVVAEKFQTGFDQPKLYAMYVDKTLTGLAAVQTLSRLNRTDPNKDGTFVLDFVNDATDIASAFEPYYGRTEAPPSDPNLMNERYGTDWSDADRLVFDAALRDVIADESVQLQAANNSVENFGLVLPQIFTDALLGRLDRNEKVVFRFLDDEELRADVLKTYTALAYGQAKLAYQEHCPIGELLTGEETAHLEYKSTFRTSASTGEVVKPLETASIKTIAAFANSRAGGTLLIGVSDDGSVHGLASDYTSLHHAGQDDRDRFQLHLGQALINALGETTASRVSVQLHTVDGHDLCRVHVPPSTFPVEAQVVVDRRGQLERKTAFYVRVGNGTREITDAKERQRYMEDRWGTGSVDTWVTQ